MSNFCIDCKYFHEGSLRDSCRHTSNQYKDLNPVYGTVQYIHTFAHDARREKCKGQFYEPKPEPVKRKWWDIWKN